jgi:hypothetical protein
MKAKPARRWLVVCFAVIVVLGACGPSQAELDAQSTQAAREIFSTQTQAAEYEHATQTAAAPTATPTPTSTPVPTATPTARPTNTAAPAVPGLYRSRQYGFQMEYPETWVPLPQQSDITAVFVDEATGSGLYIAEEDFIEIGLGESTLEQYAELTESYLTSLDGLEMISSEPAVIADGLPVMILDFSMTAEGETVRGRRLMYVYRDSVGFNATYLALEADFPALEPQIADSFDTFRVVE